MNNNKEKLQLKKQDIFSDVEVELNVNVGSIEMSMSELLETKPGDTFRTGVQIADEVSLLFKDNLVAKGRLIDQDGYFAIQVSSVENNGV